MKPTWQFPPANGGVDYVNNPAASHFSDAPIPKLVREVIQNSIDAWDDRFDAPVTVKFSEIDVPSRDIGSAQLSKHLRACLQRAEDENRTPLIEPYRRALKVSGKKNIPCLRIQDSGTTGLTHERWDALVTQEGAISKPSDLSGGSFGIGKNAVLNFSDLHGVVYSTRYVGRGRIGRVDLMQGKATLMSHPSPSETGERLQHIGFYANADGSAIRGRRNVRESFLLDDIGTGVFILGFNPRSDDWVADVAIATAENFFYAIHSRRLRVEIHPKKGEPILLNVETLGGLFERFGDRSQKRCPYYYRALINAEPMTINELPGVEGLRVYLDFENGAPRRTAYVNRRGMLVSDSRETRVNPFAPRSRGFWADYAAVVVPITDKGDMWVRQMDNPSHDSVSPDQLPDPKCAREATAALAVVRRSVRAVIDEISGAYNKLQSTNIDELSHALPDEVSADEWATRRLGVRQVVSKHGVTVSDFDTIPDDSIVEPLIVDTTDATGVEVGDYLDEPTKTEAQTAVQVGVTGNRIPNLSDIRCIPVSQKEAVIAFNPPTPAQERIELTLFPAGADKLVGSKRLLPQNLSVIEASSISSCSVEVIEGRLVCEPAGYTRVYLRVITAEPIHNKAVMLGAAYV